MGIVVRWIAKMETMIKKKFEFPDRETAQKEFNRRISIYENAISNLEQELVDFALEWNFDLTLGEYGSGRTLLLEDNSYYCLERGDWLYSNQTC